MELNLHFLLPELVILIAASVALLLGLAGKDSVRKLSQWVAAGGLLVALLMTCGVGMKHEWIYQPSFLPFNPNYISMLAAAIGLLTVLASWDMPSKMDPAVSDSKFRGEFFAMMLFSLAGVSMIGKVNDLVWLFVALELVSIPTYILVATGRSQITAQEAGVKYFFLGALAAAVFLFGFSYLYGYAGSTRFDEIAHRFAMDIHAGDGHFGEVPKIAVIGLLMAIVGISYKIAAVPMHFYTPDVYQGAATPVTALLAFAPKTAGIIAIIAMLSLAGYKYNVAERSLRITHADGQKLVTAASPAHGLAADDWITISGAKPGVFNGEHRIVSVTPDSMTWEMSNQPAGVAVTGTVMSHYHFPVLHKWIMALLATMAALTMTVGNVLALLQRNLKRTLAYSSVAHSGYMLVGLVAGPLSGDVDGYSAALFYLSGYAIMSLGTFAVLIYLQGKTDAAEDIDDLNGVAKDHPIAGIAMALCLFSLIGMPLTVGFFGKLYLVKAALLSGQTPLAIILMINVAIAAAYYLKIVAAMYLKEAWHPFSTRKAAPIRVAAFVCVVAVMVLGLFPTLLLDLVKAPAVKYSAGAQPTPMAAR